MSLGRASVLEAILVKAYADSQTEFLLNIQFEK